MKISGSLPHSLFKEGDDARAPVARTTRCENFIFPECWQESQAGDYVTETNTENGGTESEERSACTRNTGEASSADDGNAAQIYLRLQRGPSPGMEIIAQLHGN